LLLAGCAPGQLESALGMDVQSDNPETTQALNSLSGYPGPTAVAPTEPVPVPSPQLPFAPSEVDQQVFIGEITEVVALKPSQVVRYTIESVLPQPPYIKPQLLGVIIHDTQAGASIQLGDDQGDVGFEYLTEKYALWRYTCSPDACSEESKFQTGLYAHNLETGEDNWIGPDAAPEAQEDWIIYITQEQGEPDVSLRGRQLITGEDFELSSQLLTMPGYGDRAFYAINEGRVAWVETDPATQARVLQTYDLNKRIGQSLEVTVEFPRALAVSSSLVVWFDGYWQGYDLRQGRPFNVPAMPMPAELWDKPLYIQVTAQDDTLQWTLDVEEGTDRFYTAQVFSPDQAPPETSTAVSLATMPPSDPQPTAAPEVPTTVPTVPPTAYP
jgi:hypothetical protein